MKKKESNFKNYSKSKDDYYDDDYNEEDFIKASRNNKNTKKIPRRKNKSYW